MEKAIAVLLLIAASAPTVSAASTDVLLKKEYWPGRNAGAVSVTCEVSNQGVTVTKYAQAWDGSNRYDLTSKKFTKLDLSIDSLKGVIELASRGEVVKEQGPEFTAMTTFTAYQNGAKVELRTKANSNVILDNRAKQTQVLVELTDSLCE